MPHSPADEKVDTYNGGDGLKEIRSDSGAMPVPALEGEVQEERELKRDLKDRQISMIAIGVSY